MKTRKRLKRLCPRCEEMFMPTGKFQRICQKCNLKPFPLPKWKKVLIETKTTQEICPICKKKFRRWKKSRNGRCSLPNVQFVNRVTCSKDCSRKWVDEGRIIKRLKGGKKTR